MGDGIILTMDAAEIGIESAELAGVIDGISSISGPIGMTAGAIIFVGLDIYSAVKTVEKIDEKFTFDRYEKFYWRIIGFSASGTWSLYYGANRRKNSKQ